MEKTVHEKYFTLFENRWGLVNKEPNIKESLFKKWVLRGGTLASLVLSGIRTGTAIGSTHMLSTFFSNLGVQEWVFPYLTFLESLIGFVAFEGGILIVGYVLIPKLKNFNPKLIVKTYVSATLIPPVLASLLPATVLISEFATKIALISVNVAVGFSTIPLACLGGSMLEMVESSQAKEIEKAYDEYNDRKQKAWIRSKEYSQLRMVIEGDLSYNKNKQPSKKEIEELVLKKPISIVNIIKELGGSETVVERILSQLIKEKKIKFVNKKYRGV
jgi:uncharacterized membrane protein